jgi:hypothetical protein
MRTASATLMPATRALAPPLPPAAAVSRVVDGDEDDLGVARGVSLLRPRL